MRIEKINDNKIKITLDVNDLKSRNIDAKSFVSNTPESQDLFWDVMKEAEQQFGFNVDESMVYVEAHVNNTGMFTLIVTKTSATNQTNRKPKAGFSGYKLKRKELTPNADNSLYKFGSLTSLINYCKVAKIDKNDESKLYSYNNAYYVYSKSLTDPLILEYASRDFDSKYTMSKVQEYGKLIYDCNALNTIKKI